MKQNYSGIKCYQISEDFPEQKVLPRYEKVIRSLKRARLYIVEGNEEEKMDYLIRAYEELVELEKLGDPINRSQMNDSLAGIYAFCKKSIRLAQVKSNVKLVDTVLKLLGTLYEGWVSSAQKNEKMGIY